MNAAVFDRVSFAYPESEHRVLADVDVTIPDGGFVLVVGDTGSGKSTLLRAINGLVPHFSGGIFSGRVRVSGRDTMEYSPRDLADVVAFVPQEPASSFVVDRVEDELAYVLENLGLPPTEMRRRVEETLDLMRIEPLRRRSVRDLSGGERQRVAIAAALSARPSVLVLDEPTSQLDPQGAEDVLSALHRLVHDLGLTVVVAEHRLERIAGFADFAIGMQGDGVVVNGDVATVLDTIGTGPPVWELGSMLGWESLPLTVRAARRTARCVTLPAPPHGAEWPEGAELLRADDVSYDYGPTRALRRVSVSLTEGEIVALMGRNGSGKSTLLRLLCGVAVPATGIVHTHRGTQPRPGRDVALCPQTPENILYRDRVDHEVATTLDVAGRDTPPLEVLDDLGIADLASLHPRDLSAGERLLVAVAATIATGAPVLLLDEPTRGLDPVNKQRLIRMLRAYAAEGRSVMIATHDVELVASVATRVIVLAGGEVVAAGDVAATLGDSPVFAPQMTRVFGAGWLTPKQVVAAIETSSP